jgi:E3 ubiquitin-protein ligase HUWE1
MLMLPECRKSLDFRVRHKYFDLCLSRLETMPSRDDDSQASEREPIYISIHRDSVLEDTAEVFHSLSPHDLMTRDLEIEFDDEDGIDAGGLTREWYMLVCRAIFKEEYGLFAPAGDGVTYMPSPDSRVNENHLQYFVLIGMLLGKALFDQQPLDVHFTQSFYKHILGQSVVFADLAVVDPAFYKNLNLILETPLEELGLELAFTADSSSFGQNVTKELLPNGKDIVVTDSNKTEYVRLLAHHHMTASVQSQLEAFLEGFYSLIPPELVSIFTPQELEMLTCGMPEIDVDDMQMHCTYVNYDRQSEPIRWLWLILQQFSQEQRAKFVSFVTGSSKVPLEGFKALRGQEGVITRMSVHRSYNTQGLPCAHTCFNQLDLPDYPDEATMRKKLLLALEEGGEGFGLA